MLISDNIVLNHEFTSNATGVFTEVSVTDWRHAEQGWLAGSKSKWVENSSEENVTVKRSGSGGLTQVITNNNLNQGLQLVSFDAINQGDNNNVLQLQIYGINDDFRLSQNRSDDPVAKIDGEQLDYATLLDTGNIAEQSFGNSTFTQQVDFGNGYEYIVIRFMTRSVEEASELMAIDNVVIADIINTDPDPQPDPDPDPQPDPVPDPQPDPDPDPQPDPDPDPQPDPDPDPQPDPDLDPQPDLDPDPQPDLNLDNIVQNSEFSSQGTPIFTEVSITDWRNADQGWLVGSNSKWAENSSEENVTAKFSGASALTQVITNNDSNQGLQLVSFDAVHLGDYNNTLQLQIYGINDEFRLGQNNSGDPVHKISGENLEYTTLFETGNIANQQFDYSTFSQPVDFGNGYEYIAIKFVTRNVEEQSELMAIDNLIIADIPDNASVPVAFDDQVTTKKGTSITINVLNNDIYSPTANIQIQNFTQPYNGILTYENGEFVYVPHSDWVGQDSFQYTIIDNQGIKDTGVVEIIIQNPTYDLGVNLNGVSYFSPQHPFVDIFKTSRHWITQEDGTFNTGESHLLNLDENGWVKSLPAPEDNVDYERVTTMMTIDRRSHGRYVVLYEGEGTLFYRDGATLIDSQPGKDVIETFSAHNGLIMSLTETDPNNTGDYLRNIRIVPEEYADIYQSQTPNAQQSHTFNPDFLTHIDSFSTLRFMNWMETNNSQQSEWADRAMVDDYTYFKSGGVPVEVLVELVNQTNSNPWFTMPHMATDEYVENFATYVKENLNPELDIYIEYSNEVWNGSFQQARWVEAQADLEGITAADWYSRRTTEVTQIWDDVFAEDKERVIGVMGAWSANSEHGRDILDYNWAGQNALSHEEYGIDVIGIAPYFGGYIGKNENTNRLLGWSRDIDSGVEKLYREVTRGGLLNNSPEGGALEASYRDIQEYSQIGKEHGLPLVAYEGGQHLVARDPKSNIVNMFEKFNHDPRMGEIYEEYLQKWFEIGGGEFVTFSDVRRDNKYGSWGLSEVLNRDSPKYSAVTGLANTNV